MRPRGFLHGALMKTTAERRHEAYGSRALSLNFYLYDSKVRYAVQERPEGASMPCSSVSFCGLPKFAAAKGTPGAAGVTSIT
jgi:hypothetical protein